MRKIFYYKPPERIWRLTFQPFIFPGHRDVMSIEYINGVGVTKIMAIEIFLDRLKNRGIESLKSDILAQSVTRKPKKINYLDLL